MKQSNPKTLSVAAATVMILVMALALLGGCFRKHIDSTPSGATPAATRAGTASARPAPAADVREPAAAIEETYVLDGSKPAEAGAEAGQAGAVESGAAPADAEVQAPPRSGVKEADLDDEAALAPEPVAKAAPAAKAAPTPTPQSAPAKAAAAKPAADLMGEMFYIQVGSYSELENANKVLSTLMEQGYDGSKLSMTNDGQFRVQAGAFTDREGARTALEKLIGTYKGAFILKENPE